MIMNILPKPKVIECPCCKRKLKAPREGGVSRCDRCRSDIVARRDFDANKVQSKITVIFYASAAITIIFKEMMGSNLFLILAVFLLSTALLCALFRIPFKTIINIKQQVNYTFLSGFSYAEIQAKRHDELISQLDGAMDDIIGFSRYINKTDYVMGVVDEEILNFFIMIEINTEILPSAIQLRDWQDKHLAKDLDEIRKIRDSCGFEYKENIDKIKKLTSKVEYFTEYSMDG
jgi:hypothetical protein